MKKRGKILSGLLSMAMVFSLIPSTVFADTYTAGSYSASATVSPDEEEEFVDYGLSIDLGVDAAGTVTGLSVTSTVKKSNQWYVTEAQNAYTSQIVGKSVDEVASMSFDTVSEATCASYAFADAIRTAAASAAGTKVASADSTALAAAIEAAKAEEAPAAEAYTEESLTAYNTARDAALAKAQAVLDKTDATQEEIDAAVQTLASELEAAKALLVEKDAIYVTMNIPYSDFYAAEGTTQYVDIVTTATGSKFMGTTGLAKGTYNNGTSILGVTYPVKMSAATYAELKEANEQADSSANYYFTLLEEEPTAYKELTYADGSYSFSAATGNAGDASGITVSDAEATSYGNYQVDLEGVLTTGGVTINGEVQTIGGMIFETSAGNFGMACLENYWLGTRVTDVEVAFSVTGAPVLTNHGGVAFYQFDGLNGATINGVKIITDKAIYEVNCNVALKPYYTGTVKAVQTGESEVTLKGLPSDLENGTVTMSYREGEGRAAQTIKIADAVEVGNGVITTTEAIDAEKTYTITINSDNYSPITATLAALDQEYYYVTMNVPYDDYYAAEGVGEYLDVVTTATGSKFKGTTGLAKGTYNNGESILGVTTPVKVDNATYLELLKAGLTESDDYYFTDLDEEPAVYKELTVAEDGSYSFSAATGTEGDASSITVSDAYSSSYGNYQIDLEGVSTSGGVTINGEEQTITGMIITTAEGNTYGMACLENFWLGTRVPDVEVAFSAEGAPVLTNHGGVAFHQFSGLNGASITNVKIITDKGIYNVSCDVALKPYYDGEISAVQTGDQEVTLTGLPEMENATATITYSYKEEGAFRPTTKTVADAAEIVDGKVATTEALNPEYTYTVTVNSDTYSPMTATVTILDQDYYYVSMNVPYDDYYAAEGLTQYVDIVTTATGSKFKGTTGLAKGTYNDGESILGVTTPVKVDKATYVELLKAGLTEEDDYYFTTLTEEPAVYKTLTVDADGVYSFSAAEGTEGDASSITVSDAEATSYGNYQVDLEGVLTAGGVTINGEEQTISGMIFETEKGSYGMACLENFWLGTRVTDVEVAWSVEGAPELSNHGGVPFYKFSDMGTKLTGVKIITDKGIYNVSCDVTLKPYYTGTVSAMQTDTQEVTLTGLPSDLENGKVTISYSYTEEGQRRPTTIMVADAVDAGNGVIATTEALNPEYTYTVSIESDNYGPMSATVVMAGQEAYYVTMNIPYSEYYGSEGVGEYLDVVTTATGNKFKGTTGLAKGTYNNGESILGVTAPVKMDYETLVKVLHNGTTESESHYCTILTEEPAVYKTLTIAEDGTYSFSAAEGAEGDASSITVSEADTTSSYGNYQIDLEGVLTEGGVTINGETQTISGMIFTTSAGNTYGMACLENFWLGTRVTDVEVAWSAEGASVLNNHGGVAFHQFANMNGASLTNVKIITDKGIYNVACNVDLDPYYTGEVTANADNNAQVSVENLPADKQNPTMSVYYTEGFGRAQTKVYAANNAAVTDNAAAMSVALVAGKEYTVVVNSDNYAAMTATNKVTGVATAEISADAKSLTVGNLPSDIENATVSLINAAGKEIAGALPVKDGVADLSSLKLDGDGVYAVEINSDNYNPITAQSVTAPVTITSATITKGATDDVLLVCNKADSNFLGVTVDGDALTSADYSEAAGSTEVTLKGTYASKLDTGVHNVVFLYGDKDVPTTVTVVDKSSADDKSSDSGSSSSGSSSSGSSSSGSSSGGSSSGSSSSSSNASTGDSSHMVLWVAILLCAAAIITVIVRKRKVTD